jgi:hypothetical protein
MKRLIGIGAVLITAMLITTIMDSNFINPYNIKNILRWTGLFIYRGLARFILQDVTQGYGNAFQGLKFLAQSSSGPAPPGGTGG